MNSIQYKIHYYQIQLLVIYTPLFKIINVKKHVKSPTYERIAIL